MSLQIKVVNDTTNKLIRDTHLDYSADNDHQIHELTLPRVGEYITFSGGGGTSFYRVVNVIYGINEFWRQHWFDSHEGNTITIRCVLDEKMSNKIEN